MNYYNEFDTKTAAWLRELISAKLIPAGDVDTRSIVDVSADELRGYTQCHFFAGIGGWSLALQLAGWPADKRVWSGSTPCQPFSTAGKGLAQADERHLWPVFFNLIKECRPPVVFGEQVASSAVVGPSKPTRKMQDLRDKQALLGILQKLEGGLPGTCKECARAKERIRKRSKPETIRQDFKRWRDENRGHALVNVAKNRAKNFKIPFDLSVENIQKRIDNGCCEVTGISFDLTTPRAWNAPSLDQIIPKAGYTMENTRVVLYALNVMANSWGLQKIVEVSNGILRSRQEASGRLSEAIGMRLQERLKNVGSMEYRQTWVKKVTPAGLPYWAHTASARPISDNDSTGWPTPTTRDHKDGSNVTGVPANALLGRVCHLSGWATPVVNDTTGSTHCYGRKMEDGTREIFYKLPGHAKLTGATAPSSPAETEKPAASQPKLSLNPFFSMFLMGFPVAWTLAGISSALPKVSPSPKPSQPE
jgi:hypothetical protein